jgi:hypothetical protein
MLSIKSAPLYNIFYKKQLCGSGSDQIQRFFVGFGCKKKTDQDLQKPPLPPPPPPKKKSTAFLV